jgi:outer membrane lipoprotein-sorting protein
VQQYRTARCLLVLAGVLAFLAGPLAHAAELKERRLSDDEIQTLFDAMATYSKKMQTIQATFDKRIVNDWMEEESRGELHYQKPNLLRQEVLEPEMLRTLLVLNGRTLRIFYPKTRVRREPLGEIWILPEREEGADTEGDSLASVLASLNFNLEDLRKRFEVEVVEEVSGGRAAPTVVYVDEEGNECTASGAAVGEGAGEESKMSRRYRVDLVPLEDQEKLREKIEYIAIWTDGRTPWPLGGRKVDARDGGVEEVHFRTIRVDGEIDEDVFEFRFPRGTEVTRRDLEKGR